MKKLLLGVLLFLNIIIVHAEVSDLATNSKSAILMDYDTGTILYEKNMDEELPPASMTKIMSMIIIMEAIEKGKISLDDEVVISDVASNMGGSQVYLQTGEKYKVNDLLKAVAIASGNDAVVALAEDVSGSVEEFVIQMNEKARELNLQNTNFINPHGLDAENHYSSAHDMALMAKELLKHEKILEYTSIYEDYLTKNDGSNIWLVNTNKLIRYYKGIDGLKTGYTSNAGYCITITAKKDNTRLIAVVMNVADDDKRKDDIIKMLNYGFANYQSYLLKSKEESLGKKSVETLEDDIEIFLANDYKVLLKKGESIPNYTYEIEINNINNNIKKNTIVGKIKVIDENQKIVDYLDVVVQKDYNKVSFKTLLIRNIRRIIGVN